MATYNFNGQDYEVPDGLDPDQALRLLKGSSEGSSSFNAKAKAPSGSLLGSIDPDTLKDDRDWVDASKVLFYRSTGQKFQGSDKDAAEYGLDQMGWFNYNIPRMVMDAARLQSAPDDMRKAFLYLMDTYDDLEVSWGGFGRFIKGAAADPTNYVGLATLGIGTAASKATQVASKEAFKSALRAGVTAGVEGAVWNAVSDSARQSVEISANPDQEFSMGRLAGAGALGFGAGAVLGGALDYGATALRKAAPDVKPKAGGEPIPEPRPAITEPEQLSLNLTDTSNPEIAAQTRMDRMASEGRLGAPEQAAQPTLPMDMPIERRLDQVPAGAMPVRQTENITEMSDRLMEKWGVDHQGRLDLEQPRPGPYAYDGQGNLFTAADLAQPSRMAPEAAGKAAESKAGQEGTKVATVANAAPEAPMAERIEKAVEAVRNLANKNEGDGIGALIEAVKDAVNVQSWSLIPGGRTAISAQAKQAVELLGKLDIKSLGELNAVLTQAGLTPAQRNLVQQTINEGSANATRILNDLIKAHNAATTASEKAKFAELIQQYLPVQRLLAETYLPSSSSAGQLLSLSVGHPLAGENRAFATPQMIAANDGKVWEKLSAKEQKKYLDEFAKRIQEFEDSFRANERVKELDVKITEAVRAEDFGKASALAAEREALVKELAEGEAEKLGFTRESYRKVSEFAQEYVISTVFTPATVIINALPSALKTIYKPLLNYLADPQATGRGLISQYTAMWSHLGFSTKLARAAFEYEKALLSGNVDKFMEHNPVIGGQFGRVLRTFPRILNATDTFFFSLNYRGFVVGQATEDAIRRAAEQGLTKGSEKYENFINKAVEDALKRAYTDNTDLVNQLTVLRQNGIRKGYSGEKLDWYLKTEMQKDPALWQKATSIEGTEYVNNLLFKQPFSGEGNASKFAKAYAEFMNKNPVLKIMFQLFITTPIRVFEEGFRLTPGLNLAAPKFLDDLAGKNGNIRQVRAMGEAYMSMAFTGLVMSLYANGMITGGGPGNYKQRRDKENAGDWQPYTIYLPSGKTISYRNVDPFATPLKIIVNTLDNMQMYQYRKAQGEYLMKPDAEYFAVMKGAVGAVLQSVKDANLMDGFNQLGDLVDAFSDPENKEDYISRFFAQKAQLAIPNVIGKTAGLFAGEEGVPMREPKTFMQSLEARMNPFDNTVPNQRDALGYKRVISNPVPAYFGIGYDNLMDRPVPENHKQVLRVLSQIDAANNVNFAMPFKAQSYFGDQDLREIYTPDGRQTWYDRVADIYSHSKVGDALFNALVKNEGRTTFGSKTYDGTKLQIAKQIIQDFRDAALIQFIRENPQASALYRSINRNKAMAQQGQFDYMPPPR